MKYKLFNPVLFMLFSVLSGWSNQIYGKNLMPNGSFEVATVPDVPDCWDQYLGPKRIKNWYSFWLIDKKNSVQGNNSLCIKVPKHSLEGKLFVESCLCDYLFGRLRRTWVPKGKNYTLSLYMKSNKPFLPVEVTFQKKYYVKVGKKWKRYSFSIYIKRTDKIKKLRIKPLRVGKLWIDAVQLEEGIRTNPFEPSPFDKLFTRLPAPDTEEVIKNRLRRLGVLEKQDLSPHVFPFIKGKNKIGIDPARRSILVAGRPFPFFAACFMRVHLYKERWSEILDMLKDQGYSVIIATFSCRWNDSHASIRTVNNFLDMALKRGLMVVPWINPNAIKDKQGKFKKVKKFSPLIVLKAYKKELDRMIPPLKDHPAILAWYLCDEPGKRLVDAGFTKKLVEYAKKLDSNHPMYINYGSLWEDYRFYKGRVPGDIVSQAVYPIPIRPITRVAQTVGRLCLVGEFRKPVFLWLQLWGGNGRYPTPDEFTCMAYLAAIYGATGFQTWPMMPSSNLLWDRVKVVISEMKEISPVLYSRNTVPVVIKGSDYIHAMAKRLGKKVYLLAVNTLNEKQNITFVLPDLKIKKINVKFESRLCPFKDNRFKDVFRPYERHVYEIDLGF